MRKTKIQYIGLERINGPLVFIRTPKELSFDEQVELILENGEHRIGNVIRVDENIATIQVYEGSSGINRNGVKTILTGKPLSLKLSEEMLRPCF